MPLPPYDVFVIALDDFQRERLERLHTRSQYRFHGLLSREEVVHVPDVDVEALLARARQQLDAHEGTVDAIITHWDFPSTVIAPILCAERGLRSPSLRSVLQCSHKYWSRLCQREAIPALTPRFAAIDPAAPDPMAKIDFTFPMWLKPIKGFASILGRRVDDEAQLRAALDEAAEQAPRIGEPFDHVLARVDTPSALREVGGTHCLAEEYIGTGVELAHEGHVYNGEVSIHGTLDMIRRDESFIGYEHPSELPAEVLERAERASRFLVEHIGLDNGMFNVEYFWDARTDRLAIIEINPRMSQSHSYLWDMVDGCSNHEIALDIAVGRPPRTHEGQGRWAKAAKMFIRTSATGVVERVPDQHDLARVQQSYPDSHVELRVSAGDDLAAQIDHDAYSFELAELYIAADNHEQLMRRYDDICAALPFEIRPANREEGATW